MNWVELAISVFFVAVCAMAGALMLMQRMEEICREEAAYGLPAGNAATAGAVVGGLGGLLIALLCVYYYLVAEPARGVFQWLGRGSYLLIIGASTAHVVTLVNGWRRLQAEVRDTKGSRGPQRATLLVRRKAALADLRRSAGSYADLKAQDDEVVEDLIGVLSDRLLVGQRALSRIPFYGYLGTVCGILLMAQELSRLDEATETFKVLRDMSIGLILAFQTTLVALVTYLPLRKAYDVLLVQAANLERAWLALRDTYQGAGK